jgi:hypothetical protein
VVGFHLRMRFAQAHAQGYVRSGLNCAHVSDAKRRVQMGFALERKSNGWGDYSSI